jgi:hypothetical protein
MLLHLSKATHGTYIQWESDVMRQKIEEEQLCCHFLQWMWLIREPFRTAHNRVNNELRSMIEVQSSMSVSLNRSLSSLPSLATGLRAHQITSTNNSNQHQSLKITTHNTKHPFDMPTPWVSNLISLPSLFHTKAKHYYLPCILSFTSPSTGPSASQSSLITSTNHNNNSVTSIPEIAIQSPPQTATTTTTQSHTVSSLVSLHTNEYEMDDKLRSDSGELSSQNTFNASADVVQWLLSLLIDTRLREGFQLTLPSSLRPDNEPESSHLLARGFIERKLSSNRRYFSSHLFPWHED